MPPRRNDGFCCPPPPVSAAGETELPTATRRRAEWFCARSKQSRCSTLSGLLLIMLFPVTGLAFELKYQPASEALVRHAHRRHTSALASRLRNRTAPSKNRKKSLQVSTWGPKSHGEIPNVPKCTSHVAGPPELLKTVEPVYSEQARKAKYQGVVLLSFSVNEDGTTGDIRIKRGLGLGLDEAAIEAVGKWRFKPAMNACGPVKAGATAEVNFKLL